MELNFRLLGVRNKVFGGSGHPVQMKDVERFQPCHYDIDYLYPLAEFVDGVDHRELFFPKDGHPNQFGHALTARALLRHLSEGHHLPYQITGADRGILADL